MWNNLNCYLICWDCLFIFCFSLFPGKIHYDHLFTLQFTEVRGKFIPSGRKRRIEKWCSVGDHKQTESACRDSRHVVGHLVNKNLNPFHLLKRRFMRLFWLEKYLPSRLVRGLRKMAFIGTMIMLLAHFTCFLPATASDDLFQYS